MRTLRLRPATSRRKLLLSGAITLALAAVGTAYPVAVNADPATAPSAPTEIGGIRESLDYLMTTYRVTEGEALRRLQLQAQAPHLTDVARAAVGDELLDAWLDQENGGVETFLTSKPDEVQQVLGKEKALDPAQIKVVRSKYSFAELSQAADAVRTRLAATPSKDLAVAIDVRTQAVNVNYAGSDKPLQGRIKEAAGTAVGAVPVRMTTDVSRPDAGQQRSCTILACGPNMRGGLRLHIRRDTGTWGSCTVGFNVRGSNGWRYVLTAGHCVTLPGSGRQYAYHNGLPAVWEKSTTNDSDPGSPADSRYFTNVPATNDWALMPYQTDGINWSGYWLNSRDYHNLVQSQCASPSNKACSNGAYVIGGLYTWQQIQSGWVVCATGTGTGTIYSEDIGYTPGTRCGSIKDRCMTDYYTANCTIYGAIGLRVDICSRDGDSGGPLFSQIDGRAYGILSGGPPRSGACNMSDFNEYSVYAPLSSTGPIKGILENASSRTGIAMSLITTSTG